MADEGGEKKVLDEEARREKLKKAGAEYFEKVLAAQSRGKSEPSLAAKALPGTKDDLPYDETFETVGQVVETSKQYFLGTVYVACQSGSMVFAKASLNSLAAPAVLVFLHLLPLVAAIWLMSVQGALELRPFDAVSVQGSLPAAAITGAQTLLLFFALSRSSVSLVLCWVTIIPHLIQVVLDLKFNAKGLQGQPIRQSALALGTLATAAALFGEGPSFFGLVSLLLWAAAEVVSALWRMGRQRPHQFVQLLGEQRGEMLQQAAEAEEKVQGATLEFMRHALPALPILLVGLVLGEGSELVEHELSVPAVTMILLSVAAFGLGVISMLLIADGLARAARAALGAAAPLGTVVVEAAVHGVRSPLAFSGAAIAAAAGMVLRMGAAANAATVAA